MTTELVLYTRAQQALAEARTIDEVKDIRDKAVALQVYAKQAMNPQMIRDATEIRWRAERKAGQMLRDMRDRGERRGPGRPKKENPDDTSVILKTIGVSEKQSSRWQRLSELADEEYQRRLAEAQRDAFMATESTPYERKVEKALRRAEHEINLATKIKALPTKQFGVILADPEWRFVPWSEETGSDRSAANHYATSRLEEIKKRDVPSIAADDCVLALWATVPMLPQALEVMAAWGFEYRSHLVWLKNRIGTGYWFRVDHELLLIGVKGDVPAPAPGLQWNSSFDADVGEHSEKPLEVYKLLESYFPNLHKIELNARTKRDGWEAWGADAPVDLEQAHVEAS
jgi:N6-adenosine-specific RNA methylase IME4